MKIDFDFDFDFIITLPLRLNASGQRVRIIKLTNDTSFRLCRISLHLSLPRKLIGLAGSLITSQTHGSHIESA